MHDLGVYEKQKKSVALENFYALSFLNKSLENLENLENFSELKLLKLSLENLENLKN